MQVQVSVNKFHNTQLVCNSENHPLDLVLEYTENGGFILYSDATGDSVSASGKFLSEVFNTVDHDTPIRLLKEFGWEMPELSKEALRQNESFREIAMRLADWSENLKRLFKLYKKDDLNALLACLPEKPSEYTATV